MYPSAFASGQNLEDRWGPVIELLHHYYRIVHEHGGSLHNLGFTHAGPFPPVYGPRTYFHVHSAAGSTYGEVYKATVRDTHRYEVSVR